jgi:threonine dehydrogenase-like Zn-dependent dehydrogenase
MEQAAFIELGIIVLQGIHKAQIQPGESALVLGQGLIGQLANRLSRLAGAAPIIAVARSKAKEKNAVNDWGADKFLTIDELNETGPSDGYDVVIETTGDANILPIASRFARKGGRVIGLGTPRGRGRISLGQNGARPGVRITGAHISGIPRYERSAGLWTYQSEGRLFLDLLARHRLMLDDLISLKVDPAAANSVYESLLNKNPSIIGVLFDWRAYKPQRMKSHFKG